MPNHWLGLSLIALSFSIVLFSYKYTGLKYAFWLFFFVFLHQIISITNAFFYQFPLLDIDAQHFNSAALAYASVSTPTLTSWNGAKIFPFILSYFYRLDPSILTGQSLSIVAYTLSALVLYAYIKHFKLKKYSVLILIFFSINPMNMIYTSGVMREGWEVLFIMLSCFFMMELARKKDILLKNLILLILFSVMASALHFGILLSMLLILMLTLASVFFLPRNMTLATSIQLIYFIVVLFLASIGAFYIRETYPGFFQKAIGYTSHIIFEFKHTSTGYHVDISSGSFFEFLKSWVYYMFYPFPWGVKNIIDLYACLVGLVRFFLILGAFILISRLRLFYTITRELKLLLLFSFIIAFVFSLGTTNYGTSMRHHMLSDWILVLIGLPGIILLIKKLWLRNFKIKMN